MQKYYQNEPIFNGGYSRNNLPDKIKDETYVKNLDDCFDIGTDWIVCIHWMIMLLISTVLVQNILQMQFKNLLMNLHF